MKRRQGEKAARVALHWEFHNNPRKAPAMKRDMDVVRRIALETADMQFGHVLTGLEGVSKEIFGQHAIWMEEAGLIKASIQEYVNGSPPTTLVRRLTWSGCEFADAVRSDTLWKKAKDNVIKPSGSFTFGLLKDWLAVEIREGFPTLRG